MQKTPQTPTKSRIDVAVSVIHYHSQYLLAYRNASQHQGNLYEFIGGKIEDNESPLQALIREVDEEIGTELTANQCHEMGVIEHDYIDKEVCLHVFSVMLTDSQFNKLEKQTTGNLNQPLYWVEKADLLAKKYPLPEANGEILEWLKTG